MSLHNHLTLPQARWDGKVNIVSWLKAGISVVFECWHKHAYIHTYMRFIFSKTCIPKMAVSAVGSSISSDHFAHNDDFLHVYKCLKCAELERQLKETLTEFSSLQLIIKLWNEKISSVSSSKQPSVTTNTTSKNVDCEEINMHINNKKSTSHNKWSLFVSNRPSKSNKSRSFIILQTMQPMPTANNYSTLSNLQETSKLNVKSSTLRTSRNSS